MADLTVKQKQIFDNYKKTHPKMSDAEILSALVNLGQIQLSEDQKASLFFNSANNNSKMGLQIEHSANPTNQQETVFLQSGRKIVITKSQDGKDLYKYYAADGTQLKPDYFKQQEGVIRVSANRQTYTVTKNGNTTVKKVKDPLMAKIDQQQAALNKTKKEQGFLGKSWDWFKNTTGIGDGSNKAQKQLDKERNLVTQIQNGKISKKDFKDVTGLEYSKENLQKFKNGEIELKSAEKIKGYQEGQEMAADMIADMTAGMVAFGIYTAAVAAAPFTGGASIAVGVVAATATGSLLKTGIKYADAKSGGREYKGKDFGKDMLTGGLSGVLAPVTAGFGGAVGKTVATKFGVQAVTQVGKQVTKEVGMELAEQGGKEVLKGGFKQTFKTLLSKPASLTFEGGSKTGRILAWGAEASTAGAVWGGVDGGARTTYDQVESGEGIDVGQIAMSTVEGTVGGAVAGLGFGGAMKGVGKFWGKLFGKGKPKVETPQTNTIPEPQPKKTISFGKKTTEGIYTEIGEQFKTPEMKFVDVSVKGNRKIAPKGEYFKDLPDAYKMISEDGTEYLLPSVEIDAIEALTPKNGAGTRTLQNIIAYANENHEGRLFLMAAKSEGKDSPLLFYYKNGLRSNDERIKQILEKVLKGELPMSAIPEKSLMYLPPKTVVNSSAKESVNKILSKFIQPHDKAVVEHLLTDKTLPIVERFINEETKPENVLRFLDVIRRRKYNISDLEKMLGNKQVIDEKLLHTLEFTNFEKAQNITLENFNELSLQEKKDFINGLISINFRGGEQRYVDVLPDMAIFKNLKSRKAPQRTGTSKEAQNLFNKQRADYIAENEKEFTSILNSLLEQIPRGKQAIPTSTNGLNPNSVLTVKPPITSNVNSISTSTAKVGTHNVRVGVLSEEGNYFTHSLSKNQLSRLEGYLLTDPDAVLSTGLLGRNGSMKAGEVRPSIIISPKNSMEDLLVTAKNDVTSGYGARKNFFNVQNIFLTEGNEHNNYLPNLLKQKLNLTTEEYNLRIAKIKNITHIEDVEAIDKELYNAIKSVISENPIFESIMRPNVEAIYLPKGMKISEEIASFAERYDIPILFKDAADMPATRKPYVKPTVEQKSIVPKEDVMASATRITKEQFKMKFKEVPDEKMEQVLARFTEMYPNATLDDLYNIRFFQYCSEEEITPRLLANVIKNFETWQNFPYDKFGKLIKNPKNLVYLKLNEGITFSTIEKYSQYLTKDNFENFCYKITKDNNQLLDKYIKRGLINDKNITNVINFNEHFEYVVNKYLTKDNKELFDLLSQCEINEKHIEFIKYFDKYIDETNIINVVREKIPNIEYNKIPQKFLDNVVTKDNVWNVSSSISKSMEQYGEYFDKVDWNIYRDLYGKVEFTPKVIKLMAERVDKKTLIALGKDFDIEYAGQFYMDLNYCLRDSEYINRMAIQQKTEFYEALQRPDIINKAKAEGEAYFKIFNEFKNELEDVLLNPIKIEKVSTKSINKFLHRISNNKFEEQALKKALNSPAETENLLKDIYSVFPELKTSSENENFIQVLKTLINSNEYQQLSDNAKFTAKLAAIFSSTPSTDTYAILNKLNISYKVKREIINLLEVKHNSLESYATRFNTPEKFALAELFGRVSNKLTLSAENITAIKELQAQIANNGILLFSSRLPKGNNLRKIPTETYEGFEYGILNLTKHKGDLSEFGFAPGTTSENFSIDATFFRNVGEARTADVLSNPNYDPFMSSTKVGLGQNGTFDNRVYGIPIEAVDKNDYILAINHDADVGHGGATVLGATKVLFAKEGDNLLKRNLMAEEIKKLLNLSDSQYSELYSQLVDKKYFSQIKSLKLNGEELTPAKVKEVVEALKLAQFKMINDGTAPSERHNFAASGWRHNETKIFNGEVNKDFILAKVDDISEIDAEWLEYARKTGKKFILIGKTQENSTIIPEDVFPSRSVRTAVPTEDIMTSTAQLAKSVSEQTKKTLQRFATSSVADAALSKGRINLTQYGKEGIPLKYTRESFIKELDELLSSLPAIERSKIEAEFGIKITPTTFNQLGKEIVGIPVIPEKFGGTQSEQAVARLIRKFTIENEVQIADKETKELLESILQTFPEFAMTIGKKQHDAHSFSVDINTLRNLQDNLAHPKYAELDAESQLVIKYATILHDIGKRFIADTKSDHGHAVLSTEYATKILERFDLSDEVKARIIKQVKHHHWFEEYNRGQQTPELVAKVVETFGTKEDFTIAEIMAKSDYMNVNDGFHLSRKRSRVKGDGLMSESEFENFMTSSFEKIENEFNRPKVVKTDTHIQVGNKKYEYKTNADNNIEIKKGKTAIVLTPEETADPLILEELMKFDDDITRQIIEIHNLQGESYSKILSTLEAEDKESTRIAVKVLHKIANNDTSTSLGFLEDGIMGKKASLKVWKLREKALECCEADFKKSQLEHQQEIAKTGDTSILIDMTSETLAHINEQTAIYAEEILSLNLTSAQKGKLLKGISEHPESTKFLHSLLKDSRLYGAESDEFINDIISVSRVLNEENYEFALKLWNKPDFPKSEIGYIAHTYGSGAAEYNLGSDGNFTVTKFNGNKKLIETLCERDDFPKDCIGSIGSVVNKENMAFVERLCNDPDFPKNCIKSAAVHYVDFTAPFIEKICQNKAFPKHSIHEYIVMYQEGTTEMFDKIYSASHIPNEMKIKLFKTLSPGNVDMADKILFDKSFNITLENAERILQELSRTNSSAYHISSPEEILLRNQLVENLIKNKKFPQDKIADIIRATGIDSDNPITINKIKNAMYLCDNLNRIEISIEQLPMLIKNTDRITTRQIKTVNRLFRERNIKVSDEEFAIACQFADVAEKTNINEIPQESKKNLLRTLVACNEGLFNISDDLKKIFPLIPTDRETYCSLLPSIVRSLGIETRALTPKQRVTMFNSSMSNLSKSLANIADSDFSRLHITQEISKDDFTRTVLSIVKDLPATERQKVYDYFGFELHHSKLNETGYKITGYPVNLNNGKKLAQIEDPITKEVVERLRPHVIKFSEHNPIKCENKTIEKFLNEVVEVLPELRTMIGRVQHEGQDFDLMQHSLKVMQKITQDSKFKSLSESDKNMMLLASLLHDITRAEKLPDNYHALESSFDTFFIAKKFGLTQDEEIKLYSLVKHHEWLDFVNGAKTQEERTKRLQSVAYDLQHDNLFDLALMFAKADVQASKKYKNDFVTETIGLIDNYTPTIRQYIKELQYSKPLLPVTKMPKTSRIKQAIKVVNSDGSTNIKGVYQDKDGLVIIKFNEVEDWELIGFPKGSTSKGIFSTGVSGTGNRMKETTVETGNIKFFAHGLDYENQLAKFDAFSLVDSEVLLSVSYAERPETKYRFFRTQGVLLDVPNKYVHGGGNTDAGSGCGKFISDFKNNYIFGGHREEDRLYVSKLIKSATGMSDDEYVRFVKKNENKSMSEIEPADIREKIIKALATINSNNRHGNREYNEMYASNPSDVMGVFAYSEDNFVGQAVQFVEKHMGRLSFLKKYALERDIPMYVFGD